MPGRPQHGTPRVAIACEGGGSHTAFTAGVLDRLLAEPSLDIVALSGTSGGAVCATLAWRGLLEGDPAQGRRRLDAFWADNSTTGLEAVGEAWVRLGARLIGEVVSPEISPYRSLVDLRQTLARMVERHCGLDAVPRLLATNPSAPRLLISATDVLSGEFVVFRSHDVTHGGRLYPAAQITAEVIVASAAIPTLFRAVSVRRRHYWDGVFTQNPPVRELPDMVRTLPGGQPPDEIWVIRINPKTRSELPRSMGQIRDRRNELAGIISLEQELYFIDFINRLIADGAAGARSERSPTKHRPIVLRSIRMGDDVAAELDFESKLDRTATRLDHLRRHGRERADAFLADRDSRLEPAGDAAPGRTGGRELHEQGLRDRSAPRPAGGAAIRRRRVGGAPGDRWSDRRG